MAHTVQQSKRQLIRATTMGEPAAKKPQLTGPLARLPWDINIDIISRLPAKSVFCCEGVCKPWRHISTDPSFVAARALSRPAADVVLYRYEYREKPSLDGRDTVAVDVALDLLPISSDEETQPSRLIRYPNRVAWLLMLASSNGVLMFRKEQGFYLLCNPVTRQWAELPRLPLAPQQQSNTMIDVEHAFYFHANSGEYRLLCHQNMNSRETWWILAVGAAEPRRVDMRAAQAAGITKLVPYLRTTVSMHVELHGCLHWPPHQATAAAAGETEMVVFDVSQETFHLMAGPPTTTAALTKVFDMDGLLVAADFGKEEHIDLWFLEDYSSRRWELRHRVETPWGPGNELWDPSLDDTGRPMARALLSVAAAGDGEGNVMLGNYSGLVVYNVKTKTVKTDVPVATFGRNVLVSRHVFKENLEKHPCHCSVNLSSSFHFE